jgi:hypothetical protein
MAIGTALAKISWKQLIVLVPDVAKAAKAVWKQWESAPKPEPVNPDASLNERISAISRRLEALENNETSQSKVVSEMAEQLLVIANGLKETAARQALAMWLSIGAAILSVFAIIIALLT